MLAKKERIFWLAVIAISIIATFVVTALTRAAPKTIHVSVTPQSAATDTEREADQWFNNATFGPMPTRYSYTPYTNLDAPRLIYEGALKQGAPWANYPEQIALYVFRAPPEVEGYAPNAVRVYYGERNANIAVVIITDVSAIGLGARETRIDFVKVDSRWKIVWAGDRSVSASYP
jgi:hypothetical protein